MNNTTPAMQQVLDSICPPRKVSKYTGLTPFDYVTRAGTILSCWIEYTKAEKQTRDDPGSPEYADVCYAEHCGIDILEDLADHVTEAISVSFLNGAQS